MPETSVFRRSLWPFSFLYAAAVGVRNFCYRTGILPSHGLPVRVVSVGNLTVGGTGKTPLVIWLVESARALGLRPGVLSRGYGRAPGDALNDEGMLLRMRMPDLPQVQDPDRVRGGRQLLEQHAVDVVILDDGFQHRRLRRDWDIVCLDALRPLAQNRVLPAGDLREPRSGLRRADALVLTRAGAVEPGELQVRKERLRDVVGRPIPIFAAEHRPAGVTSYPDREQLGVESLRGRPVHLVSAIARPASFEDTARELGAEVVAHRRYRDHHRYTQGEVAALVARARADGCDLLTTEKDAVKLSRDPRAAFMALRIDLRFFDPAPEPADLGLH